MEIFYYITGILAVIACCEIYRTYLGLRSPTKKEHFLGKLRGTRNMIWDLQFKVFKTREIREEVRQEYDYMMSRIATFEDRIKNWPEGEDPEEKARLVDQKQIAERDAERFLAQMKQLDIEVEGAKPNAENPDGATGIVQQIDSLKELEGMLRDWIKEL